MRRLVSIAVALIGVALAAGAEPATGPFDGAQGRPAAVRIACGSRHELRDARGNMWAADAGLLEGECVDRGNLKIDHTDFAELYRHEHYGMQGFAWPVPNGKYAVSLHFAETFVGVTAAKQRVFSVGVCGTMIEDVDVFAAASGANRALVKTVHVNVTDGVVTIAFTPKVNNPEINGIEIVPEP